MRQFFGDGLAIGQLGVLQRLDIAGIERLLGDRRNEALELVVAGDEVGLRIDLNQDALLVAGNDGDQALGGDAAGLLGSGGEALLAQPIDRLVEVAPVLA
jgi:hypothetical protein